VGAAQPTEGGTPPPAPGINKTPYNKTPCLCMCLCMLNGWPLSIHVHTALAGNPSSTEHHLIVLQTW
jgi:hypothetical protein